MAMLENASYIQAELPKNRISGDLRTEIENVCSSLIGTKHDVISELADLDELIASEAEPPATREPVERIVKWLWEDVSELHNLVLTLRGEHERHSTSAATYVLVMESATNIVSAFNRTKAAAEQLEVK